jgi:DNA-3-methyladenine glycosylase
MPRPLPTSFFRRPADVVAPELLGCRLTVTPRAGRTASSSLPTRAARSYGSLRSPPGRLTAIITEVEAYLGTTDPASHAWKGRRVLYCENLYAPPGTWYVYLSYGVNWCANLTTLGNDPAHAVLLRGVLAADEETLRTFRRRRGPKPAERNLSDGPGKMTQALGIDVSLDGVKMAGSWAEVFPGKTTSPIRVTPRIGLTRAIDWPMRWVVYRSGRS